MIGSLLLDFSALHLIAYVPLVISNQRLGTTAAWLAYFILILRSEIRNIMSDPFTFKLFFSLSFCILI